MAYSGPCTHDSATERAIVGLPRTAGSWTRSVDEQVSADERNFALAPLRKPRDVQHLKLR
jgi:hypothetical protein